MQESQEQLSILDTYTQTDKNIVVSAVAGCGKTTTLLLLLERTVGDTLFVAFNRSIVQEIQSRVSELDNVNVATLHSIGCTSLFSYFKKNLKVKPNKSWDFIFQLNAKWKLSKKELFKTGFAITSLYDIYRVTVCKDIAQLKKEASRVNVFYDEKDHLPLFKEFLQRILVYNKAPLEIDFIDMIYLPAIYDVTLPTPNNLFIDEAQDLNMAQHIMVDKMRRKGRFVSVGDEKQSIYAFNGAHSQSFQIFLEKENTISLPLSTCYRCVKSVVRYARRYNPKITPYDMKEEGAIRNGTSLEINEGDMVVCRNNAPLVELFFELVDREKRAFIKGKDIGAGLLSILKEFEEWERCENLKPHFKQSLHILEDKLRDDGVQEPVKHPRYRNLIEKYFIILRISVKFILVRDVAEFIEKIFKDNTEDDSVILTTIHKAKGLENDTVFFLNKQLIPSKFAETKEQFQQENNLLYVGVTRAKERLIFINNGGTEDYTIEGDESKDKEHRQGRLSLQWH